MNIIKEILLQLFFVLMPVVIFHIYYRDKTRNYSQRFLNVTCSLCLFLSMTFSASVVNGIFFDIRYVIMFFGLIFGGLQTGFLLFFEFMLYRFYLGGEGRWIATIIILCTFPSSVLLYKIYNHTRRKSVVILIAGMIFSVVPLVLTYEYDPRYVATNLAFHIFVIPVQNMFSIWLVMSFFNKSVSDKELFINHIQNEKVQVVSHVAASLAHEVRNPLTAVKGFLKLIRDNRLEPEKFRQYIDISMDEIQRTESILSEYLSISKPLTERREHTNLSQQLLTTTDIMKPFANMNNVLLKCELPLESVWIYANPDEIKQFLMNFVKNSVEACSQASSGEVLLKLTIEAKTIILVIKDNGIGMTEAQMSRLGSIYFSTKSNGTGIGLTYSYQVVRALGGAISVKSKPHGGTQFTITLPLLKEQSTS